MAATPFSMLMPIGALPVCDIVDAGVRSNEVDDDFTARCDVRHGSLLRRGVGISSYARLYILP